MKKIKTLYYGIAAKDILHEYNEYHKGQKVLIEGWDNTLESVSKRGYITVNVEQYWNDDAPTKLRKLPISEIHKVDRYEDDTVIYNSNNMPLLTTNKKHKKQKKYKNIFDLIDERYN